MTEEQPDPDVVFRVYWPAPRARWWRYCQQGGGPNCYLCTPPDELRCLDDSSIQPCMLLGEHTVHRDGFGRSWVPAEVDTTRSDM